MVFYILQNVKYYLPPVNSFSNFSKIFLSSLDPPSFFRTNIPNLGRYLTIHSFFLPDNRSVKSRRQRRLVHRLRLFLVAIRGFFANAAGEISDTDGGGRPLQVYELGEAVIMRLFEYASNREQFCRT
jgi:hypothetical protein